MEEAKARRERLAKMRSLLFHQEIKLKHLAKIKSKDYHRRAQRAAKAKVPPFPLLSSRNPRCFSDTDNVTYQTL